MKTWIYTANSYYKTASYILEEGPWWSFTLETAIQNTCSALSVFPIPFGSKIRIERDFLDGAYETYTLKEYYGSIGDLFHIFVCMPVTEFCWKKRQETRIETDYEQLKKERQWESQELFEEEG